MKPLFPNLDVEDEVESFVSIAVFQMNWRGKKQPFNTRVSGNKATVRFQSGPEEPPEGSKWSLGIVCVPKTEYKSVCEVCDGKRFNENTDALPI